MTKDIDGQHPNHVCEGCGVNHMHYLIMIKGKWWCDACDEWHEEHETCSTKEVRDYRNSRTDRIVNGDWD